MREAHERRQLLEIAAHRDGDQPQARLRAPEAPLRRDQPLEIACHALEARADANVLVGRWIGCVERYAKPLEAARHAFLGAPLGQRREVGVGGHLDAARDREAHHIEETRMQERLPHPLQLQLAQRGKLLDDAAERLEAHERRRRAANTFAPVGDRAHAATKIALPDRLDLDEMRQRNVDGFHTNATRYFTAPTSRQNTETGGINIEVTSISAT